MEFVSLSAANLDTFADLYVKVFNAPPWNDGWSAHAVQERFASFGQHPAFHGLGIVQDGLPIAMVLGDGERWVDGWHFHIREMCVATSQQRRGLGRRLLHEFECRLASAGFTSVFLETGRAAPARSFYEGQGYRELSLVSLGKRIEA